MDIIPLLAELAEEEWRDSRAKREPVRAKPQERLTRRVRARKEYFGK